MRVIKIIPVLIYLFLANAIVVYGIDNSSEERGLMLESYIVGDGSNNYLGNSISAGGDFNGDGINDLVIGANGAGKNGEGRIYIFYGRKFKKNLLASNADLIINGENRQDNFGWSISFESDINNDGKTDLLVSAISADNGFKNSGTVYLFYGTNIVGEIDVSKADKKFIGLRNFHLFGWSVSSGGDINGDGKSDIVIGAAGHTKYVDRYMAGNVYVFFGNKFKDTMKADDADVIISGDKSRDQLGNSVSIKGDVNGDGIDDLLSGAFLSDSDSYRGGRAYLFYGKKKFKKSLDASDAELIIKADGMGGWVGNKVIIIPDINGDKLSDFIVSAPGKNDVQQASGAAYVFYGSNRKGEILVSDADLQLKGKPVGRKFGSYIAVMGDINDDGNTDLAISEPGIDEKERKNTNLGSVYFFLTNLSKTKIIEKFAVSGQKPNTQFGNCVSVSDLDGDGIKEVIIGSYYDDSNGEKSGVVYIYKMLVKK